MKKQRKGFSLIEIIVVMAIMTIMTSMFFTVDGPRKKLEIQRESYLVAQNIRRMENMSASIQANPKCSWSKDKLALGGLLPQQGYAFYYDSANKGRYILYANCQSIYIKDIFGDPPNQDLVDQRRRYNSIDSDPAKGNCNYFPDWEDSEKWYPAHSASDGCDFLYILRNKTLTPYSVDETVEKVSLPSGITIDKAQARDANGNKIDCKKLWIGFEPPDPATYIYCEASSGTIKPSIAYLIIKQDGKEGDERIVEMNLAGLVWVRNK